jgi:hypothetical protein
MITVTGAVKSSCCSSVNLAVTLMISLDRLHFREVLRIEQAALGLESLPLAELAPHATWSVHADNLLYVKKDYEIGD